MLLIRGRVALFSEQRTALFFEMVYHHQSVIKAQTVVIAVAFYTAEIFGFAPVYKLFMVAYIIG